ncbi:DUF2726 domain-containing protein [Paenirhodobacter enshiensis]|uniref:DUF2726 domain-containing protein n=1 Tax=Paenirhodobacter enshiensis TaxID=1105367 RepID=UPI0035B18569
MSFISAPGTSSSSSGTGASLLSGLNSDSLPLIVIAVIGVLVLVGAALASGKDKRRRSRPWHVSRPHQPFSYRRQPTSSASPEIYSPPTGQAPAAPNSHLDLVQGSAFRVIPLLNRSEARLLPILERIVEEIGQGHRVMAQVAMGEVLRAVDARGQDAFDSEANRAINAKRLDFVIIDRRGLTVAALEYQGSGHHLNSNAFLRDAVKREALRKAGLTLIELPPDTNEKILRNRLIEQTALPVGQRAPRRPFRRAPDPKAAPRPAESPDSPEPAEPAGPAA